MEKTTLYGINSGQNANSRTERQPKPCASCLKLQAQISDLNLLLTQSQANLQSIVDGCESQIIKQVQGQLVDLREKFAALKKRVKQVEKENDDLFTENTTLEKQLTAIKAQLRQYEAAPKPLPKPIEAQAHPVQTRILDNRTEQQRKQMEIQLFVAQEKVRQLEGMGKEQAEQIAKLKDCIRKRTKQQAERTKLLQMFS